MRIYIGVFLLSIFLIPFILSFFIKEIPNNVQPSLEATQIIYKDILISQMVISEMDNFSGIGMSIKNPYFRNKKDLAINIIENGNVIRSKKINGANIPDGDLIRIDFDEIKDSKNKTYLVSFAAPDADNTDSLELFLTSKTASWLGDLNINSEKKTFKISLITYHKSANPFAIASKVFGNTISRLFADLPFATFYLFLVSGLMVYLFKNREVK